MTVDIKDKIKKVSKVDLDIDFKASAARLSELRNSRLASEIPFNDEYWVALKNHNKYFGVNK